MSEKTQSRKRRLPSVFALLAALGALMISASLLTAMLLAPSAPKPRLVLPSTSTSHPTPQPVVPVCKDETVGDSVERDNFFHAMAFRKLSPTLYLTHIDEPKGSGAANTAIVFNTNTCEFSLLVTQPAYSGPTSERPASVNLVPASKKNMSEAYPVEWDIAVGDDTIQYGKVCTTVATPLLYLSVSTPGVTHIVMTCPWAKH